ncbi:hypothetical protein GCM10010420_49310 [Streptomyces glaucosporus]|uniref:DUF4184 family protein n=1 Tax=Streptomyces glaucosporus TaxID=284044 RepID=A0ABN3ITZ0_9ACTN
MPFTLSHAAAALPGIRADGTGRGPLVASALVAGTLAPDMTYYAASAVPAAMRLGDLTHSPAGVLTVDVAIAAVLVGAWLLLREPLLALLPGSPRGKAYALTRGRPWRGRPPAPLLGWGCASAALGAATHVFWDSFTHMDRWGVRWITVLDERVLGVPLYHQLQYGGSALALVAIAVFLAGVWRRLPGTPVPEGVPGLPPLSSRGRRTAVALLAAAALAGAAHRCARRAAASPEAVPWEGYVPTAMFGAGAGLALALVVYTAVARALAARSRRGVREPVSG